MEVQKEVVLMMTLSTIQIEDIVLPERVNETQ